MPTTTKQLAKITGVSESTIRNWTDVYSDLLTPAARGDVGTRLFSDEDVQILRSIADLRRENVPPADVIDRLQRGDIYIEIAGSTTPQQATTSHNNAPDALLLVRSDLQRQINDIKRNQSALLRAGLLWGIVLGAIGGLAAAALFMWGLYLFG